MINTGLEIKIAIMIIDRSKIIFNWIQFWRIFLPDSD